MGASDVLALPSWSEGMPNVVWEALASGRPVVATSVGGIADALSSGQAGIIVPPKNEESLADALCAALCRTWDVGVLVANGPPSWKDSAALLYDVLVDAVARKEGRPRWKPPRNGKLAIL
jgi:hypothetical protein